ncbi:MAG TPA: alpha/beta fold hydrolase [Vicinamibacterales bacterium]|nr:alpha/beta fold hydrolase [Vicinamibacterales bacterium]
MRHCLAGILAAAALSLAASSLVSADDSGRLLTIDHFVRVQSTVPSIAGQPAELYVRERVQAGVALRGGATADRVVLFVHGAGTPAEVAFDVPYQDYSWMAYLAAAGFDVFSVDMSGYGRSVRPPAENDPCNLAPDRQKDWVPALIPAPCAPTHTGALTTIASDWHDVDAAVDYVRALRHVDKVSMVAWSLGGPRAGGYAAQHPEKVNRLVLLAPAYSRTRPASPPSTPPAGAAFNTQSHADLETLWNSQVGCPAQYEPAALESIWAEMLKSDPVGATWGPGVRRAPNTATWGWNQAVVAREMTPTLMVSGAHDKQVPQDRVRELYADLGATQKVFVDLACSSHNAMWEKNHLLLFKASLEWLEHGTVDGQQNGMLRLGY